MCKDACTGVQGFKFGETETFSIGRHRYYIIEKRCYKSYDTTQVFFFSGIFICLNVGCCYSTDNLIHYKPVKHPINKNITQGFYTRSDPPPGYVLRRYRTLNITGNAESVYLHQIVSTFSKVWFLEPRLGPSQPS